MITFRCAACQKQLSVKDQLAGKKGKCPGCGKSVAVPADEATVPPRRPNILDEATLPPSQGDMTQGGVPGGELTEFLSPAQQPDELGRLGKYRMLKILGRGGMGVVFQAEDPTLRRRVALKAMLPAMAASPSAGKRFLREAQAMAAVEHDHVVRVYQADEERGIPFLAMEFLKGEPLDDRIEREGKLPTAEVLRIGREAAEGLAAAHATGLIHRDIKPANIWLESPRGRVKILDFGLARAVSEDSGLTQQGAIMGTPAYMAPEQARGEPVDTRCDLFSLGVLLYRLCTGRQPFRGKDAISTIVEVATHEPPPPRQVGPDVPPGLSDLIMRLLEKDAAKRPPSAQAVVEAIQALEAKQAGPARPDGTTAVYEPPPVPQRKRRGKRPRTPVFIAAALLALVPLGWWLASVVLRVETDKGTLIVEINDAETEARVKNGKLILSGPDGKTRYTLSPGQRDAKIDAGSYKVRVEGADGLSVDTSEFTLKKDGKVTVRVTAGPNETWVALFNGKDLTGWKVDSGDADRWSVEDGQIVASGGGSGTRGWLLTDKAYADFSLKLEYKVDAEADGALAFRAKPGETVGGVPQHVGVKLTGYASPRLPRSGALYYGVNAWEQPDGADGQKEGAWNKLGVRVVGNQLRVWINGEEVQKLALNEFADKADAFAGLERASGRIGLQQHTGKVRYRKIEIQELAGGKTAARPADFVPLFNGTDLTGWTSPKGGTSKWAVVDGAITCSGPGDHLGTTRGDFGDFHLRAEVKINAEGNSGIYFRAGKPVVFVGDYEAQICTLPTQQKTGSLYNLVKFSKTLVPPDTWFTFEIIALGDRIRLLVDGTETADYTETRPDHRRAGYIHLQHHDPKTKVHFRTVEVKVLKP